MVDFFIFDEAYEWMNRASPENDSAPRNPEDDVLDDIDRLVSEEMARGRSRDHKEDFMPRCPRGNHEWHGLPTYDCPGPYSTEKAPPGRGYGGSSGGGGNAAGARGILLGGGGGGGGPAFTFGSAPIIRFWRVGDDGEMVEVPGNDGEILPPVVCEGDSSIASLYIPPDDEE